MEGELRKRKMEATRRTQEKAKMEIENADMGATMSERTRPLVKSKLVATTSVAQMRNSFVNHTKSRTSPTSDPNTEYTPTPKQSPYTTHPHKSVEMNKSPIITLPAHPTYATRKAHPRTSILNTVSPKPTNKHTNATQHHHTHHAQPAARTQTPKTPHSITSTPTTHTATHQTTRPISKHTDTTQHHHTTHHALPTTQTRTPQTHHKTTTTHTTPTATPQTTQRTPAPANTRTPCTNPTVPPETPHLNTGRPPDITTTQRPLNTYLLPLTIPPYPTRPLTYRTPTNTMDTPTNKRRRQEEENEPSSSDEEEETQVAGRPWSSAASNGPRSSKPTPSSRRWGSRTTSTS
jgi:hypothetical protein